MTTYLDDAADFDEVIVYFPVVNDRIDSKQEFGLDLKRSAKREQESAIQLHVSLVLSLFHSVTS